MANKKSTIANLAASIGEAAQGAWTVPASTEQDKPALPNEAPATIPAPGKPKKGGQASRQGKKIISAYLPETYRRQLNTLAAQEECDVQDLMAEAFDDLFNKRKR